MGATISRSRAHIVEIGNSKQWNGYKVLHNKRKFKSVVCIELCLVVLAFGFITADLLRLNSYRASLLGVLDLS